MSLFHKIRLALNMALRAFCGTFPRQVTLPDPHLACSPPPHTTQCHSPVTDELQEGNSYNANDLRLYESCTHVRGSRFAQTDIVQMETLTLNQRPSLLGLCREQPIKRALNCRVATSEVRGAIRSGFPKSSLSRKDA